MSSSLSRSSRMLGGLWGAVAGDALGVPVEFSSRAERDRDPVTGVRGFGTYNQPPGTWSDDSSLLLCTVLSLTQQRLDLSDLGQRFVRYLTQAYMTPHGQVFDVGTATMQAIERLRSGVAPEHAGGTSVRDNGNGSLMRILPVALRFASESPEQLVAIAHRVSRLTHGHPRSQLGCGYLCLLVAQLLSGLPPRLAYEQTNQLVRSLYRDAPWRDELPVFARLLSGQIETLPRESVSGSGYVISTLEASVYLLLRSSSYEQAVLAAINLGEDTDTTACVTGGLAGVWFGPAAIPADWLTGLARRSELDAWFSAFVSVVEQSDS